MAMTDDSHFNVGDMKVPIFYSSVGEMIAYILLMPLVGVVFGGIHCIGWFFNFPSSDEATLWRVFDSSYWHCLSITYIISLRGILIDNFKQPSRATRRYCYYCFINDLTIICSVSSSFFSRGFHLP